MTNQAHEPPKTTHMIPPVATTAQVARALQTTPSALSQDRYKGIGIPYVKIGSRVRYLREDVLAYINANRHATDTQKVS